MKNKALYSIMGLGVFTTLNAPTSAATTKEDTKLPNVIFILADDLGYGDLGCYGQEKFKTPNIDKLSENGVQFMQNYAGAPVSAPSRTSIMTGRHTGHSPIRGNKGYRDDDGRMYDYILPDEEITLGEIFKSRSYTTACIGKWGMGGPNTEGNPNAQGFDYAFGYLSQSHAHSYFPAYIHENNKEIELNENEYTHDLAEDKALEFIKENRKNPFFLYLAFTIPHAELCISPEYMTKYDGRFPETPFERKGTYGAQEQPRAAFASMIERLDLSVGRVIDLLEKYGLDENTLVIFTSDNGAHCEGGADPEFFNSTGIFRGIKRDLYEGGIRVPLIASWKGTIAPGVKNNDPVAFWDILPTCAEIIGAETPRYCDGLSLLSLLKSGETPKRDYLYWEFCMQGGKQALLMGDWKLIGLQLQYKDKCRYELYNLANDPSETTDLATQEPKRVKQMLDIMMSARTANPDFPLFTNEIK